MPAVLFYDGMTGIRRTPVLVAQGDDFVLDEGGQQHGPFAFADLVMQGQFGGQRQYGLRKHPGWRISFEQDPPAEIAAMLPGAKRYGGLIDRFGLVPTVLVATLVSALVVFGVIESPPLIARMIPRSTEARLGDMMMGDFGGRTCTSKGGVAALKALTTRIGAAKDIDIRVVDVNILNAVTLPGGHILVFRRLLDEAQSPEELAGVIGHELGHVENRDVLVGLVRQFGLSIVLGGLDSHVGSYTNALLSASYGRTAESRADGYAIDRLAQAHVSPMGTAAFFKRMSVSEGNGKDASALLSYFESHPMSAEREAKFAGSAKGSFTPALDPAQWQALKTICSEHSDPSQREMRF
jgi:Zn-dependent protease with chaperone function